MGERAENPRKANAIFFHSCVHLFIYLFRCISSFREENEEEKKGLPVKNPYNLRVRTFVSILHRCKSFVNYSPSPLLLKRGRDTERMTLTVTMTMFDRQKARKGRGEGRALGERVKADECIRICFAFGKHRNNNETRQLGSILIDYLCSFFLASFPCRFALLYRRHSQDHGMDAHLFTFFLLLLWRLSGC